MSAVATTKLSSKGQVVIPEDVREKLSLKAGTQLIVIGEGDAVILKIISPPTMDDFKSLMDQAQQSAKELILKKDDINKAIQEARLRKKK